MTSSNQNKLRVWLPRNSSFHSWLDMPVNPFNALCGFAYESHSHHTSSQHHHARSGSGDRGDEYYDDRDRQRHRASAVDVPPSDRSYRESADGEGDRRQRHSRVPPTSSSSSSWQKTQQQQQQPSSSLRGRRRMPEDYPYYCDACQKGFKDGDLYQRHVDAHLHCEVPGCRFTCRGDRPQKLEEHMELLHNRPDAPNLADVNVYLAQRRQRFPTKEKVMENVEDIYYKAAQGLVLPDERRRWMRQHGISIGKRPRTEAAYIIKGTLFGEKDDGKEAKREEEKEEETQKKKRQRAEHGEADRGKDEERSTSESRSSSASSSASTSFSRSSSVHQKSAAAVVPAGAAPAGTGEEPKAVGQTPQTSPPPREFLATYIPPGRMPSKEKIEQIRSRFLHLKQARESPSVAAGAADGSTPSSSTQLSLHPSEDGRPHSTPPKRQDKEEGQGGGDKERKEKEKEVEKDGRRAGGQNDVNNTAQQPDTEAKDHSSSDEDDCRPPDAVSARAPATAPAAEASPREITRMLAPVAAARLANGGRLPPSMQRGRRRGDPQQHQQQRQQGKTLYEKLTEEDRMDELGLLLQAVRFIVRENFFQ